jgi:hypothetical protein
MGEAYQNRDQESPYFFLLSKWLQLQIMPSPFIHRLTTLKEERPVKHLLGLSKVKSQKSKVKSQRSKVKGQKSKVKGQQSKVKGQQSKCPLIK